MFVFVLGTAESLANRPVAELRAENYLTSISKGDCDLDYSSMDDRGTGNFFFSFSEQKKLNQEIISPYFHSTVFWPHIPIIHNQENLTSPNPPTS